MPVHAPVRARGVVSREQPWHEPCDGGRSRAPAVESLGQRRPPGRPFFAWIPGLAHREIRIMKSAGGISRRDLLMGTAKLTSAAALLSAVRAAFPSGVVAAPADTPETTRAVLGFIALTDSSPLVIAVEKGFFAKYGMPDVEVLKQASWGTTRDNIELGSAAGGIDGAHILTPMPYLISTGKVTKNNVRLPMYILARLNTNGQCISVAKRHL